MTAERKKILVWHDHWQTYRDALERRGLLDLVGFTGLAAKAFPDDATLEGIEGLLGLSSMPAGILARMPRLRWIHAVSVGVDDWLRRPDLSADVVLICARGTHRIQMPENILGGIFHAAKPFARARQLQLQKTWDGTLVSTPIAGRTLCIVGPGAIGRELARKARALDMRVVGVSSSGAPVDNFAEVHATPRIDEALAQSDYVVLLVPQTPLTSNLMNRGRFEAMKQDSWLLNFARGDVVNDDDLLDALRRGHLAGAILDAFRKEPLPPDHPFWTEDRIIVLPHLGGKHPHRNQMIAELLADNIERSVNGHPWPDAVDRHKGY